MSDYRHSVTFPGPEVTAEVSQVDVYAYLTAKRSWEPNEQNLSYGNMLEGWRLGDERIWIRHRSCPGEASSATIAQDIRGIAQAEDREPHEVLVDIAALRVARTK